MVQIRVAGLKGNSVIGRSSRGCSSEDGGVGSRDRKVRDTEGTVAHSLMRSRGIQDCPQHQYLQVPNLLYKRCTMCTWPKVQLSIDYIWH